MRVVMPIKREAWLGPKIKCDVWFAKKIKREVWFENQVLSVMGPKN